MVNVLRKAEYEIEMDLIARQKQRRLLQWWKSESEASTFGTSNE